VVTDIKSHRQHDVFMLFALIAVAAVAAALVRASSVVTSPPWPSWKKASAPFIDICYGSTLFHERTAPARTNPRRPALVRTGPMSVCGKPKTPLANCSWITSQSPNCYNPDYLQVAPPDFWNLVPTSFTSKFFDFQAGIHLSEGIHQRFYYNADVDTCARYCVQSSGGLLNDTTYGAPIFGSPNLSLKYVRCLSFDFFPFETPNSALPYNESSTLGTCVLNSGNKDVARLRNVDQSFTDAELFAFSYYQERPFSNLEGYYEVRCAHHIFSPAARLRLTNPAPAS